MENQDNFDRQSIIPEIKETEQETTLNNHSMLVDCANWEAYNNRTCLEEKVNNGFYVENVYSVIKNETNPSARNFRRAWYPQFANKYFENVSDYLVNTKGLVHQAELNSTKGKMPDGRSITAEYLIFLDGKLKGIAWTSNTTTTARIHVKLNSKYIGQSTVNLVAKYIMEIAGENSFNFYLSKNEWGVRHHNRHNDFWNGPDIENSETWNNGHNPEEPRTLF